MNKTAPSQPKKQGLFSRLTGAADLRAQLSRLEAFLNAVPGLWCGFTGQGGVAAHDKLAAFLKIPAVRGLPDIQGALHLSDAAVLEGRVDALAESGEGFDLRARSADGARYIRIQGRRGTDSESSEQFDILWFEDVTHEQRIVDDARNKYTGESEGREKLQMSLDYLPHPVWMRDAHTNLIWCNRAYAQAVDATPASVIADQKEFAVKGVRAPAIKGVTVKTPGKGLAQAAFDTGRAVTTSAHIIVAGQRRLMEVSEIPMPSLGMTLGSARDITREEELESEQKRNSSANKELLELLGSAIGIFDAGQRLEFYNNSFAQLWGLEDNYLNTHPKLGDLMEKLRETRRLPEQADFRKYKQTWLNMFTNLLAPHEEMLYLPDGRSLRMLAVAHPMGGLMTTFEDVSSRLALESSYNTLVAVQKETLDHLSEGVAAFGGDGRLKFSNPSFGRIWALNPEDLEGQPHVTKLAEKMKQRFPKDQWPRWQKLLVATSIDRSIDSTQEGRMPLADGTLLSWSAVPLPDGGILITYVDITDTVEVENALREKNVALETAERLKLDFLANVSYQLRTPLNAIIGFNEILRQKYFGSLNERQEEYTDGIQEAGERLMSLIDDILDLSTIEAGYMELEKSDVPVAELLSGIRALTENWARKEKIEIIIDCPAEMGTVSLDPRRIKQALLNLVRNAITFSPEGGVIVLSAFRENGNAFLAVKDSGPGIAAEDQGRIFEPFEKVQAHAVRGAGLGLTLVRNIVALHGGEVLVHSAPGQGATFIVRLPS